MTQDLPAGPNDVPGRIHFLDSLRAVLMTLGVVLHSAQVYNPAKTWSIFSERSSVIAGQVVDIIHLFRIPAFFVVSGFFCAITLARYGPAKFARIRLKRILVPLATTAITLNSLQAYILARSGWRPFDLHRYVVDGGWDSHLWFLIVLAVYFVAAALATWIAAPILESVRQTFVEPLSSVPLPLVILLLPTASVFIQATGHLGLPLSTVYWGVLDVSELAFYLPFFLFGTVLGSSPTLFRRFSEGIPVVSLLAAALVFWVGAFIHAGSALLGRAVSLYLEGLLTWCVILVCFVGFRRLFNRPSRAWFFLADASYTVYLFHHIIVVALGLGVIAVGISAAPGLLVLVSVTYALTLLLHRHWVARNRVLRFLFNGK